jgi:CyaY protein
MSPPLDETSYDERAFPELRALIDALDALDAEGLETELAGDILTLEFRDGAKYVINSHRAARQIWMAAERSAWHFDWIESSQRWVAAKTGDELWATLSRSLSKKLDQPVELRRP